MWCQNRTYRRSDCILQCGSFRIHPEISCHCPLQKMGPIPLPLSMGWIRRLSSMVEVTFETRSNKILHISPTLFLGFLTLGEANCHVIQDTLWRGQLSEEQYPCEWAILRKNARASIKPSTTCLQPQKRPTATQIHCSQFPDLQKL